MVRLWSRVAVFGVDIKGAAVLPCRSLADATILYSQARSVGERSWSEEGKRWFFGWL